MISTITKEITMKLTKKEAEKKYPEVIFDGESFWIHPTVTLGQGCWLEQGCRLEQGCWLEQGCRLGQDCWLITFTSKYNCNIQPYKDHINIRIGCESHPIADWTLELQEQLADKHDRVWWDKAGKRIFSYLLQEAEVYQRR
jgi:bifunctional N-acetylglucosamine-1-phosphate-uridyltransferase/glucosamine-1-phosphate-acetyltransferase GlmU-like protein